MNHTLNLLCNTKHTNFCLKCTTNFKVLVLQESINPTALPNFLQFYSGFDGNSVLKNKIASLIMKWNILLLLVATVVSSGPDREESVYSGRRVSSKYKRCKKTVMLPCHVKNKGRAVFGDEEVEILEKIEHRILHHHSHSDQPTFSGATYAGNVYNLEEKPNGLCPYVVKTKCKTDVTVVVPQKKPTTQQAIQSGYKPIVQSELQPLVQSIVQPISIVQQPHIIQNPPIQIPSQVQQVIAQPVPVVIHPAAQIIQTPVVQQPSAGMINNIIVCWPTQITGVVAANSIKTLTCGGYPNGYFNVGSPVICSSSSGVSFTCRLNFVIQKNQYNTLECIGDGSTFRCTNNGLINPSSNTVPVSNIQSQISTCDCQILSFQYAITITCTSNRHFRAASESCVDEFNKVAICAFNVPLPVGVPITFSCTQKNPTYSLPSTYTCIPSTSTAPSPFPSKPLITYAPIIPSAPPISTPKPTTVIDESPAPVSFCQMQSSDPNVSLNCFGTKATTQCYIVDKIAISVNCSFPYNLQLGQKASYHCKSVGKNQYSCTLDIESPPTPQPPTQEETLTNCNVKTNGGSPGFSLLITCGYAPRNNNVPKCSCLGSKTKCKTVKCSPLQKYVKGESTMFTCTNAKEVEDDTYGYKCTPATGPATIVTVGGGSGGSSSQGCRNKQKGCKGDSGNKRDKCKSGIDKHGNPCRTKGIKLIA